MFRSVVALLYCIVVFTLCLKKVHLTLRFILMVICILELANKIRIIACYQSRFQSVQTLCLAHTHTHWHPTTERLQKLCRLFYRTEKVIKLFDMLDVDMKYELAIRQSTHKNTHTRAEFTIWAVGSQRVLVYNFWGLIYTAWLVGGKWTQSIKCP